MHLEALEDLLAVRQVLSISHAADLRGVSQPTLSRRLAALERWAEAALVDRSSHRLELTPAGQRLALRVEEALRALETGREEARDAEQGARNVVRLACTHMLSSTFFPGGLAELEPQLDPQPSVQLIVADMQACEQHMRRGDVQLLLCHHAEGAPAELAGRSFVRLRLGTDVLTPVSAAAADGAPCFPLDGSGAPDLLAYRLESGLGRLLRASGVLDRAPRGLRPAFHSHAALTLANMARLGKGVAWLPLSLAQADLAEGKLARAGDGRFDAPVEICLIRPRARQAPVVEAVWALAAGGRGPPT